MHSLLCALRDVAFIVAGYFAMVYLYDAMNVFNAGTIQ